MHPVSLPALMRSDFDGRRLRVRRELGRTEAYTRYFVTYRSDDLRISGVLNVPSGRGPFPTLVLNHGYIDPADYVNGQGLLREQDYLARAGYVVLHTDYRNHAQSGRAPAADRPTRSSRSGARGCRTSTATASGCSAGPWAAESPWVRSSCAPAWSTLPCCTPP